MRVRSTSHCGRKTPSVPKVSRGHVLRTCRTSPRLLPVDLSDVWLAGTYRELHRDFEDNLIAAAATRCGADILVTNDEQFLRHCPVRAMDVADTLTYLRLSAYR